MPGFILHFGATVTCSHGGQALPAATNPRVLVSGQPVVTVIPYTVAGCPFPPPPAGNGPCVTAPSWIAPAVRVFAGGMPVLVNTSQAIATPTGTPLIIAATQVRVQAT